jgi:hypothetical protein
MAHILKNNSLEIHVDLPLKHYKFSRFDWTGKITKVSFQNVQMSGVESPNCDNDAILGKAFYNEFGIDTALGFEAAQIGGWFHKIGVGLLQKDDKPYQFHKAYKLKPATFTTQCETDRIRSTCTSENVNGYAYILKKEIVLKDHSFSINYMLQNTGDKAIVTDEYVHNFTAINNTALGQEYQLKFPFQLQPAKFLATVNPQQKVTIGHKTVSFNGTPIEPFFFSNLTGDATVDAQWTLLHHKQNMGIRETGSFKTNKINLWGTTHVISPELFIHIDLKPGETKAWTRHYEVFEAD